MSLLRGRGKNCRNETPRSHLGFRCRLAARTRHPRRVRGVGVRSVAGVQAAV